MVTTSSLRLSASAIESHARIMSRRGMLSHLIRPDTSTIFISAGLGFFLEFTHLEAQEFIEQKLKHLKK